MLGYSYDGNIIATVRKRVSDINGSPFGVHPYSPLMYTKIYEIEHEYDTTDRYSKMSFPKTSLVK